MFKTSRPPSALLIEVVEDELCSDDGRKSKATVLRPRRCRKVEAFGSQIAWKSRAKRLECLTDTPGSATGKEGGGWPRDGFGRLRAPPAAHSGWRVLHTLLQDVCSARPSFTNALWIHFFSFLWSPFGNSLGFYLNIA